MYYAYGSRKNEAVLLVDGKKAFNWSIKDKFLKKICPDFCYIAQNLYRDPCDLCKAITR